MTDDDSKSHECVTLRSGLERLWKEVVVASFEISSLEKPGGSEESYEIVSQDSRCPSQYSKRNCQNTNHKRYCLSQLEWQDNKI